MSLCGYGLQFLLSSLACWRLAVMLTADGGPYKIFQRLRAYLKKQAKKSQAVSDSDVASGIQCIRCSSVWIAAPLALLQASSPTEFFVLWMAISGLAILINRLLPPV